MPVHLLSSHVKRWPNKTEVDSAARAWASGVARQTPAILALGYFGSYSRGDWGFGSDLDVVAVLERCTESFERRRLQPQYLDYLPVPVDLLIYSQSEFAELPLGSPHFARLMLEETTWLFGEEHARELLQTVTAP